MSMVSIRRIRMSIERWCKIRLEDDLSAQEGTTGERPGMWHTCCGTHISPMR